MTEIVRQSDQTFFNVLNSVCLCTADENIELLKVRFIDQSEKSYPHDALHIYAEYASIVLRYQSVLNNVPGEVYSTESNDKIPDDYKYPFSVI